MDVHESDDAGKIWFMTANGKNSNVAKNRRETKARVRAKQQQNKAKLVEAEDAAPGHEL
jgi:hypothetical protein